jgi:Family of unknown function (DUF6056)
MNNLRRSLHPCPLLITAGVPALLWALALYCYGGLFSRYIADDYCTAAVLKRTGFIASQQYWYETWSGRFSFAVIVNVLEFAGPKLVPYLPAATCCVWFAVSFWAVRQYGVASRWRSPSGGAFLMTAVLLYSTLRAAPNLGQSFYWQTGIVTYTLPIILLTAYLFVAMRFVAMHPMGNSRALQLAIAGALTFVAGGLSETTLAVQTAALTMAVAGCWFSAAEPVKRDVCAAVLAGFFGSVLSFVLVATAPGNVFRRSTLVAPPPPGWGTAAILSVRHLGSFLHEFPHQHPAACAVLPCVGALFAVEMRRGDTLPSSPPRLIQTAVIWLVITLGVVVLVFSAIFPSIWGQGEVPPGRALFLTTWILSIWLVAAGAALGGSVLPILRPHTHPFVRTCVSLGVVAMLVVWTVSADRDVRSSVTRWRQYAEQWDRQDLQMRAAEQQGSRSFFLNDKNVSNSGPVQGLRELGCNPYFWVNQCVASYYGFDSVVTVTPEEERAVVSSSPAGR